MDHLAEVFVQDTCQLQMEGRSVHLMFSHNFFRDPLFVSYENDFRSVFEEVSNPMNDPTLNPINQAIPLLGVHIGEIKNICNQGMTSVNHQIHQMNLRMNEIMPILYNQQAINMHMQHVLGGAVSAHLSSPFLPSVIEGTVENNQNAIGTPGNPERTNPGPPDTTTEPCSINVVFPSFDRLAYHSLEQIYDDWFGSPSTPFHGHGGLKALHTNRAFRAYIATNKQKKEADKKMLQKMRRIGEYFEAKMMMGQDKETVMNHIRLLISNSPKNDETLTGVDQLLTKEQKSHT